MNTITGAHWDAIYRDKREAQTSWFRPHLDMSLRLIDGLQLSPQTPVIDVGGGRSTLVDDLLARGFPDVTVLDIAQPALDEARVRLGIGAHVNWLASDVLEAEFPAGRFGLWHDRAVFHFLVDAQVRRAYVQRAAAATTQGGGHAIVATFASDGPERCSTLPVRRYDAPALAAEFAPHFAAIDSAREEHTTPWGTVQPFTYVVLRRTQSRN